MVIPEIISSISSIVEGFRDNGQQEASGDEVGDEEMSNADVENEGMSTDEIDDEETLGDNTEGGEVPADEGFLVFHYPVPAGVLFAH